MDFPPHPFWDFALDVYRRPGVSDACLQLQENQQVDVNLLLFVCWIGASGRGRMSGGDVTLCIETVRNWHETVVRPLRAVRRRLKSGFDPAPVELTDGLRRQIQAREIDAEHIEQLMLAAAVVYPVRAGTMMAARMADAGQNALVYLAKLDATVDNAARASLAMVLSAAFPDVAAADVRAVLENAAA